MNRGAKFSQVRKSYRRLGQHQRRQIRLEILRRAAADIDPLDINDSNIKGTPRRYPTAFESVGKEEKSEIDENERVVNPELEDNPEEDENSSKFEVFVSPTRESTYQVEQDDESRNSEEYLNNSDEDRKDIPRPDVSPITPQLISPSSKMQMHLTDNSMNADNSVLTNGDQYEYDVLPGVEAVLRSVRQMQHEMRKQFHAISLRLDSMEQLLTRELSSEFPPKPDRLPLQTLQDLAEFETIDAEEYNRVVDYLGRLSNGSLNETCVTVFKAAFSETLAPDVTTHGAGEARRAKLDGTRFLKALYAAVAKNRTYEKPTWRMFLDLINNALRAVKQRLRRVQTATSK